MRSLVETFVGDASGDLVAELGSVTTVRTNHVVSISVAEFKLVLKAGLGTQKSITLCRI